MAEPDLYYTGGTIIMDHGHGISTIYSHLEKVMVEVGDHIKQGDIIGTVGSTGRSTGQWTFLLNQQYLLYLLV